MVDLTPCSSPCPLRIFIPGWTDFEYPPPPLCGCSSLTSVPHFLGPVLDDVLSVPLSYVETSEEVLHTGARVLSFRPQIVHWPTNFPRCGRSLHPGRLRPTKTLENRKSDSPPKPIVYPPNPTSDSSQRTTHPNLKQTFWIPLVTSITSPDSFPHRAETGVTSPLPRPLLSSDLSPSLFLDLPSPTRVGNLPTHPRHPTPSFSPSFGSHPRPND